MHVFSVFWKRTSLRTCPFPWPKKKEKEIHDVQTQITAGNVEARAEAGQGIETLVLPLYCTLSICGELINVFDTGKKCA